MTTPNFSATIKTGFYSDIALHNPCALNTEEYIRWSIGAINGNANRQPPNEHSTPAYYEGWQWGSEWDSKPSEDSTDDN
jgi:hypothetical protein